MNKVVSHPYKFQLIPVGQINVNRLYQRPTKPDTIKHIVNEFDWHNVNPIKVVWNHEEWYAFDGQHTSVGLRILFGDDYLAPCLVYEDVDGWFEEAELFEKGNKRTSHKATSIIDEWHSRLFRGEPKATKIKTMCANYKLRVPTETGNHGDGCIMALSALEKNFDSMKPEQFDQLLFILTAAWGGAKDSLNASILNGLGMFIRVYWNEYNRKNLIKRLRDNGPASNILRAGKASVAQGHAKYAREILNIYNKNTTTGRLPDKLG